MSTYKSHIYIDKLENQPPPKTAKNSLKIFCWMLNSQMVWYR